MVSMAHGSAPMVKAKLAPKAWAERSRLPRLTAFEAPSMPMAKNPRAVKTLKELEDGEPLPTAGYLAHSSSVIQ
jgi:hypothetical protein